MRKLASKKSSNYKILYSKFPSSKLDLSKSLLLQNPNDTTLYSTKDFSYTIKKFHSKLDLSSSINHFSDHFGLPNVLPKLTHPNMIEIIQLDQFKTQDNDKNFEYNIIMPGLIQTTLDNVLNTKPKLHLEDKEQLIQIIKLMINVGGYLNEANIPHGFISPKHIFTYERSSNYMVIGPLFPNYIIDDKKQIIDILTRDEYLAPELRKNLNITLQNIDLIKSDVFAMGLVLLRTFGFKNSLPEPNLTQDYDEAIRNINAHLDNLNISEFGHKLKDILPSMIHIDPSKRPTFTDINKILNGDKPFTFNNTTKPNHQSTHHQYSDHGSHPGYHDFQSGIAYMKINDFEKAAQSFQKAADLGHNLSTYQLAMMYLKGEGIQKDMNKGIKLLTDAANKFNSIDAQLLLAEIYLGGIGVEKDPLKAHGFLEKAANQGNARAAFQLGILYNTRQFGKIDTEKGQEYLEIAAKKGLVEAKYMLGVINEHNKDINQAIFWYTQASNENHKESQYKLGLIYAKGTSQDKKMAKEWLKKAAEQGHAGAQNALGDLYELYQKEAHKWYTMAADQGEQNSQNSLGTIYLMGFGVNPDPKKAKEFFEKSSMQGNAQASLNLGYIYCNGKGVDIDYDKGMEFYLKAAEKGLPDAEYNIGVLYLHGFGRNVDYLKAKEWYEKAEAKNHAQAAYGLAELYTEGKGVEKNIQKAKELAEKSIKLGYPTANALLAAYYIEGWAGEVDEAKGLKYLLAGAEKNDPDCMFNMGVVYFNGNGVAKNLDTAKEWFTKAAELGHEMASNVLRQMKAVKQ